MRIQFQILLFILCLNLATGLVISLSLPGTEYVQSQSPGEPTDYESHFNATDIGEKWQYPSNFGLPFFGDIIGGFTFLFQNVHFLIDGFPILLTWVSDSYITDASGRNAFSIIANVLRAIYAVLMSMWFIEYIGGRYFTD